MLSNILEACRGLLDIVLRVPPLFAMDMILKSRYSITLDLTATCIYATQFFRNAFRTQRMQVEQISLVHIAFAVLHIFGFIVAVFSLLLPTKQLLSIYLSAASGAVIFWSYVMNEEYVKYCLNLMTVGSSLQNELFSLNRAALQMFFGNYFSQAFWAIIFCFSSTSLPNFPPKRLIAGISFIFPTLASIMPLPASVLSSVPVLAMTVEVSFLAYYMLKHRRTVYFAILSPIRYFVVLIDSFGVLHFIVRHWRHINIMQVCRVFWLIRTVKHALFLLHDAAYLELEKNGVFMLTQESILFVTKEVFSHCCDTFLAVLGLTCTLISIIMFVVAYIQQLLFVPQRNLAPVISVLFITLAMQTGLTGLEPEERLLRVYRNIILIFAAVSHSVHEDMHTALVSLSASGNISISRHIKALSAVAILIIYSSSILVFLLTKHSLSAWLLAASAFSIEVLIKVALSFLVYIINLIDTQRMTMWESFDDYMFCITAAGHITSFLFNLILFFNAGYILVYESIGVTRIMLVFVHLYCNIWSQVKTGWRVYHKRQFATKLVQSLHKATDDELRNFDDVCSVCHQPLHSARITGCNHFFHDVCLKKWLNEQNSCPFCHKQFYLESQQKDIREELPVHEHQE